MGTLSPDEIQKLSVDERLELIGDLWDSLEPEDVPIPPEHLAELERRMASLDEDLPNCISWEQFKVRAARNI